MTAIDPEYPKKWYQKNKEAIRNNYINKIGKDPRVYEKKLVNNDKQKQKVKETHRQTIFTGGHTNSDRNLHINYDYSEGDIVS